MTYVQDVFDAGDSEFFVEQIANGKLEEVAKTILTDFFKEDCERKIAWVFYKTLFRGLIKVRDGVSKKEKEDLVRMTRTYNRDTHFEIWMPIGKQSLENYLTNVDAAYIQLCDSKHIAVGLQRLGDKTALGHYSFAPSVKGLYSNVVKPYGEDKNGKNKQKQ